MIHDADAINGKYPSLQVLHRHLNATTHQNNNGLSLDAAAKARE
jgi:hypothetical protein